MMKKMILITGLGNPGQKYQNTRHNIGFKIVNDLQTRKNFPDFKEKSKFNGVTSKKGGTFLLKPQTYMNKSGLAVRSLVDYYDIANEDLIVIHDEADIRFGKVKIDKNRSSAGHKGVQSIINHLNTKDFWRVRVGIGQENKTAKELTLQKFNKEERKKLETLSDKVIKEITNQKLKKKTIQIKKEEG